MPCRNVLRESRKAIWQHHTSASRHRPARLADVTVMSDPQKNYMLHRVLPEIPDNPTDAKFTVTPRQLDQFLESHAGEDYVLSFDDGFRDNLVHALPVLEKHDVKATIYLTTGFINGTAYPLDRWLYPGLKDVSRFKKVRVPLKKGSYQQRLRKLERLIGRRSGEVQKDLYLSWDEVQQLHSHPLITLGAHTHTHPNLEFCPPWVVWEELTKPLKILQTRLGFKPDTLAYPYGGNSVTARWLAKVAGYRTAVTTRSEAPVGNPFRLPRIDIMKAVSE